MPFTWSDRPHLAVWAVRRLARFEGAAGVDKTTVWREAIQAALERGYGVLVTDPAEPDASLSFAGLGDPFDVAVSEVTAALADPQRRALTAALLLEEASEPTAPEALRRAVLTVIRRLAAAGQLVVAIDAAQWLDRTSARVLAFVLSRLVSPLDLGTTDLVLRAQLGRTLPRPLLKRIHAECGVTGSTR